MSKFRAPSYSVTVPVTRVLMMRPAHRPSFETEAVWVTDGMNFPLCLSIEINRNRDSGLFGRGKPRSNHTLNEAA
jgi:hypothetical protein